MASALSFLIFLLATATTAPPTILAFELPRNHPSTILPRVHPLHGSSNNNNNNNSNNSNDEFSSAAAYSVRSNAWGYSRTVVNARQRRRYERRRVRHRLEMEGKLREATRKQKDNAGGGGDGERDGNTMTWAEKLVRMNENIGAADAFMGNVHKGSYDFDRSSDTDGGGGGSSSTFDDDEMDEDGYWGMFGTRGRKKRGFISSFIRQMIKVPYRALFGEYKRVAPGTLILVRHGESQWNANKTFTGWADPDLSAQGYREVEHAARLLVEGGYNVDIVFTSRLKRAIRSSWILLRELNEVYLPVFKSWRLNERMYGALTGLSKTETAELLGAELVQEWRGSLLSRPPALTPADRYYPGRDRRHADLSPNQIPLTESLLDCMERTKPVWFDKISYELACGRNVLVVAHANTLRGLVKIIDGIGDDEIQDVAIPTGIPIIYNFDKNLNPIPPSSDQNTVSQVHMKGVFLEKPGKFMIRACLVG